MSGPDSMVDTGVEGGVRNEPPVASFTVSREAPLVAALDASESSDDQGIVSYDWDFGDGETGSGELVEHTYAAAGCYEIALVVADAEAAEGRAERTTRLIAAVGSDSAGLAIEGVPTDGALLPRDPETNEALITIEGAVPAAEFEAIVARVTVDMAIEREVRADLCGDRFSLELAIPAELAARRIDVALVGLGTEAAVAAADDVVAGDVILVNGQSNAVAREFSGSADENLGDYVRSFGSRTENVAMHAADDSWHRALAGGAAGAVGQWPLRMAAQLSARLEIPIAVINSAHGGRPIAYFARNDGDHTDPTTNYGRLLDRTIRAGAEGRVRVIIFYQGESDGANATAHHDGFVRLHENWREDYPGVEHFYVTQVRRGCGGQVETREVQRRFSGELPDTSVMSTTGLDGHDGCHYAYEQGYREL